jgi:hypothetical protein
MSPGVKCDDWITGEEGDEADKKEDQAANIGKSTSGEDASTVIVLPSLVNEPKG